MQQGAEEEFLPRVTQPRTALAFLAGALVLLVLFYLLGVYVTAHGEPPALYALAKAVRGHATGLAWAFTNCGWIQVLGPLFVIAIVIAIRYRAWSVRMAYLMCSCLITWGVTDWLQRAFARPRRSDWLIRHEHAFSYPSSHASTSTAFYLLAGVLLLTSELPARIRYLGFAAGVFMWAGICWSRLSLAAHYPTDVAGGILLGAAIALLGAAVVRLAGKTAVRA